MRAAITAAIRLAGQVDDYRDFRARYHASARQRVACDARETVPAAGLACLARGDARVAVEYAANFGRDTDTIAAMTGAVCGAVGASVLPEAVAAAARRGRAPVRADHGGEAGGDSESRVTANADRCCRCGRPDRFPATSSALTPRP
jgi:hypothetical protein